MVSYVKYSDNPEDKQGEDNDEELKTRDKEIIINGIDALSEVKF